MSRLFLVLPVLALMQAQPPSAIVQRIEASLPPPANIQSSEAAQSLEDKLRTEPSDWVSRSKLVTFYRRAMADQSMGVPEDQARTRLREHLLTLIEQDPTRTSVAQLCRVVVDWRDNEVYPAVRQAWLNAAARNSGEPVVAFNAARALASAVDHQEILRLLGNTASDAQDVQNVLAEAYASAIAFGDPVQSERALTVVTTRSSQELMKQTGMMLRGRTSLIAQDPRRGGDEVKRLRQVSEDLILRGGGDPAVATRLTVSGNVQQAKLLKGVPPQMPPVAAEARIRGIVRFTVVIGKDGTVQNLQLVSGHPLLVPAATDAVKQYQYGPTFLNGRTVEVTTQVDVHFPPTEEQ